MMKASVGQSPFIGILMGEESLVYVSKGVIKAYNELLFIVAASNH